MGYSSRIVLGTLLFIATSVAASAAGQPNNLILFIPDGLRAQIVDEKTAPTFARLRDEGVNFVNSHSLFPTFTTANASAFATGHYLGDTGDFSNYIFTNFAVKASGDTVTPFLETDPVLREVNAHFDGNYLHEEAIVAAAQSRMSTALVGKLGPVAIFDLAAMNDNASSRTLILDDSTGSKDGVPLSQEWLDAIKAAGLKPEAPGRGGNGSAGNNTTPGTLVANFAQQQFFLDLTLRVILPKFKAAKRSFVLVYWSRDPDGSQHNQGDSFGSLTPGINGPTSLAGIRMADMALAAIEQGLKSLGLAATTNIVVAADHGFSTIAKDSKTSVAAKLSYADVNANELPVGFLAIDLASALKKTDTKLRLFDPDDANKEVIWSGGTHSKRGNGIIGAAADQPQVVIAANGGSDLVYIPDSLPKAAARKLAAKIVAALLEHDYVSGLFVDTRRFGELAGALSLEDIGLIGNAVTPVPAIVVNFASRTTGCDRPTICTANIADTTLQKGQGMHGSFSRSDTWNFMAARGPDFRAHFADPLPASNADIGRTVAHLLQLEVNPRGKLRGRVLTEALGGAPSEMPQATARTLESKPATNGLKTILRTQSVGEQRYFDIAGFPGRTVGLE
ncbi:MAG: alkaline phosphatase family protein [Gammaproteobacteria bacterium]